jgi:DNA-binding CsgD family transcriptional regulator
MELAGREVELAAIAESVESVRTGTSRVLAVLGEGGLGKTALLAALRERAEAAGMLVLEGRGAEHERDVPFAVAVDAFDDHVAALHNRRVEALDPALGAVLPAVAAQLDAVPAGVQRFHQHRALRGLLEALARERPVALLLDDLHWADDASVHAVLHLLRRPPRAPTLIAFAVRPLDPAPRLLAAASAAPAARQLVLRPLGHTAAMQLLAALPDAAQRARVAREGAGNPLFLHELARVAAPPGGPLPATLMAAIRLELAALDPAARTLVAGAAVVGDTFDPALAAAAAGLSVGAAAPLLDELVAADLVRAACGPAFSFRHQLVRRAVYDDAPPAWRVAAHERAAAALEARGASRAARAFHVERSALPGDERAIALLTEAGADAAGTAPGTAADLYAAALRLVPEDDAGRRAALLAPRALALMSAGRLEASRAAFLAVLALPWSGDPLVRLELVAGCARVETQLTRHAEARRRLLAALAGAPPAGEALLALELGTCALWAGDGEELATWSRRALDGARRSGRPELIVEAEAHAALGADWSTDAAAGERALDRAAAGLAELDDELLARRLSAALYVGTVQMFTERHADAALTAGRGLAIAHRTGQGDVVAGLLLVQARARLMLLDLDGALGSVEAGEEAARMQEAPYLLQIALRARADIHHHRGEALESERAAAECAALIGRLPRSGVGDMNLAQLAGLRADRQPAHAIEEILGWGERFLRDANPLWPSALLLVLVRATLAAGRLDDARLWSRRADEQVERMPLAVSAVRAAIARAELRLADGDAGGAAELAASARAAARAAGALLDAEDARLLEGRALAAAGDEAAARAALQRVAADAGRAGAGRLHDAAARELRRLGTRVSAEARRAARRAGPAELTVREREIAALVGQGRSNKEVAATLFLSEKTIENTLSRVYGKLGVRSRVELARAALPA